MSFEKEFFFSNTVRYQVCSFLGGIMPFLKLILSVAFVYSTAAFADSNEVSEPKGRFQISQVQWKELNTTFFNPLTDEQVTLSYNDDFELILANSNVRFVAICLPGAPFLLRTDYNTPKLVKTGEPTKTDVFAKLEEEHSRRYEPKVETNEASALQPLQFPFADANDCEILTQRVRNIKTGISAATAPLTEEEPDGPVSDLRRPVAIEIVDHKIRIVH
jgi:hypothetical protein